MVRASTPDRWRRQAKVFLHSMRGVVQLVRTPACHAGGRGFESCRSCQNCIHLQAHQSEAVGPGGPLITCNFPVVIASNRWVNLYFPKTNEVSFQTRCLNLVAAFVGDSDHGLPHTGGFHECCRAGLLQAHGRRLWKTWNAAVSSLLPDHNRARSCCCHQEFVGC